MRRRACVGVVVLTAGVLVALPGVVAPATPSPAAVPAGGKPPEPNADSPGAGEYRPVVDQAVADLSQKLGVAPLSPFPFIDVPKKPEGEAFAAAIPYGDPPSKCLILIFPKGQKLEGQTLRSLVVHEVFHCYAFSLAGVGGKTWVVEGAAMWAEAALVGAFDFTKKHWNTYLDTPGKSLFGREHDAIGFFGHLEDVGLDPWPVLVQMIMAAADSDAAAFAVAEAAGGPAVVDNWPSGLAREPSFGAAWETGGAGVTSAKPTRLQATVGNSSTFTKSITKASNAIAELDLTAEVVTVTAVGARGHFRDSAGTDQLLQSIGSAPFCTKPGGCVCPPGTAGEAIPFKSMAPGTALLAATGGALSASVAVQGKSLELFCKKPGKVDKCLVGTWVSQEVTLTFPGLPIGATGGAGAVLTLTKNGTGSVDFDPMAPFAVTLPGGASGTIALTGQASGVVSASKGVITSLTTGSTGFAILIEVPGLGGMTVPAGAFGGPGGPLDGTYECTKTTLTYSFASGIASTWSRQQ